MKTCSHCKESKPLEAYEAKRGQCRECRRSLRRGYYRRNAETAKAYSRAWYAENKDRASARSRDYYLANREETLARQREYHQANRDADLEYKRRWRESNPDYQREYVRNNPDRNQLYSSRRRARMASVIVDPAVTIASLRERGGDCCCYCRTQMDFTPGTREEYNPARASVEHITPISKGGDHVFGNTALACLRCNLSKGDRIIADTAEDFAWRFAKEAGL